MNHAQPWPPEWRDDWFVVGAAGTVSGPLSACDVFAEPQAIEARYVSRRGFAQWYNVEDFAGLWQSSRQMAELLGNMSQPETPQAKDEVQDDEIIRALSLTGVDPAALMAPVSSPPQPLESNLNTTTALQPLSNSATESSEAKNFGAEHPKMRWLSRRGSQRLGKLVNPVIPALLSLVTFGFGHVAWLLGSLREVVWHLDHDANVNRYVKHQWMAWIPGLHLKTTWDLACLIRAMEEQDGYTSTSPHVAVMLGVCPPLSSLYLQHAMNDHWLVHCVV